MGGNFAGIILNTMLWVLGPLLFPFLNISQASPAEATLVFVGDAMCHQAQIDAARRAGQGDYSFDGYFTEIESRIKGADYAVVNIETPLAPPPYSGYPCFNAPGNFARELRQAGFDLFLTANNHTLDRRSKGARHTLAFLDSLHVDHIGTYASDDERLGRIPFVKDINGFRVGFLNYTYGTNGFTPAEGFVVDYIDRDKIASDVAETRSAGAEIIVMCIHWGVEYVLSENRSQRELAEYIHSLGVEAVVGGHPHVVQPFVFSRDSVEPSNNRFTAYSLGNFVSNMRTTDTRGGAILSLTLRRDASGKAHLAEPGYEYVFVEPYGMPGKNFRVVPVDKVATVMRTRAEAFLNSTGKFISAKSKGF